MRGVDGPETARVLEWCAELRGLMRESASVEQASRIVARHLRSGLVGAGATRAWVIVYRADASTAGAGSGAPRRIASCGPVPESDAEPDPSTVDARLAEDPRRPYVLFGVEGGFGFVVDTPHGGRVAVMAGRAPLPPVRASLLETVALNVARALLELPAAVAAA